MTTFALTEARDTPDNIESWGHSLWFELPNMTTKKIVERVEGAPNLSRQEREKYSDRFQIRSSATGIAYSLYMCYGQWRIGASKTNAEDKAALEELFS